GPLVFWRHPGPRRGHRKRHGWRLARLLSETRQAGCVPWSPHHPTDCSRLATSPTRCTPPMATAGPDGLRAQLGHPGSAPSCLALEHPAPGVSTSRIPVAAHLVSSAGSGRFAPALQGLACTHHPDGHAVTSGPHLRRCRGLRRPLPRPRISPSKLRIVRIYSYNGRMNHDAHPSHTLATL